MWIEFGLKKGARISRFQVIYKYEWNAALRLTPFFLKKRLLERCEVEKNTNKESGSCEVSQNRREKTRRKSPEKKESLGNGYECQIRFFVQMIKKIHLTCEKVLFIYICVYTSKSLKSILHYNKIELWKKECKTS